MFSILKLHTKIFILFVLHISAFGQIDTLNFIKGADVSFLPQMEDSGGVYKDEGVGMDALDIFKNYDFNYIRLKIWHTPEENYNNLPRILEMASRIKEKGFKFLLNFHYSDTWADPGNQTKPAAWQGIPFADLVDSVYTYTKTVIAALDSQDTAPHMVQIGNEINGGMLWNDGRVGGSYNNWSNLADLLNAGISGVRDGALNGDSIKIMIHRANATDFGGNDWFFGNLSSYSVDFDIIGLSYYPWWHGTKMSDVGSTLNNLVNKYDKDVIIAETAYPWTFLWNDNVNNIVWEDADLPEEYPVNTTGQSNFLRDLMQIVGNVNNQRGMGIFYWEPEYISAPNLGSPWENVALFDFNSEALSTFNVFKNTSDLEPVNATIIINTSTNWDTLQENHFVQLRGEVTGESFQILPDGKKITNDASSDMILDNIGGDYWKIDFQIYPGDELSYKIWSGKDKNNGTYLRIGWEGAVTAYNGSITNKRTLVAGENDTVVTVQYYNSSAENRAQYWQPFDHKEDSIAVYFRVNMDNATSSGRFNPELNGPLSVRGDSAASGGMLSWQVSNITLIREENSVNGGSFWAGVGYLPKLQIENGSTINFKFFIENDIYNGWENSISDREMIITPSLINSDDTTLHWVYFDNNIISSLQSGNNSLPKEIELFQNYPNPFNPVTKIRYSLTKKMNVKLIVTNILGEQVRVLDSGAKAAGNHFIEWDGRDNSGNIQSSGLYFIHLITVNSNQTIKALLIK